jgi:hypothetical protein
VREIFKQEKPEKIATAKYLYMDIGTYRYNATSEIGSAEYIATIYGLNHNNS